jgi:hypothetical protein
MIFKTTSAGAVTTRNTESRSNLPFDRGCEMLLLSPTYSSPCRQATRSCPLRPRLRRTAEDPLRRRWAKRSGECQGVQSPAPSGAPPIARRHPRLAFAQRRRHLWSRARCDPRGESTGTRAPTMTNGHPSSLKTAETTRRASTSCGLSATDVRLEVLVVDELGRFDLSFSTLEEEFRVERGREGKRISSRRRSGARASRRCFRSSGASAAGPRPGR